MESNIRRIDDYRTIPTITTSLSSGNLSPNRETSTDDEDLKTSYLNDPLLNLQALALKNFEFALRSRKPSKDGDDGAREMNQQDREYLDAKLELVLSRVGSKIDVLTEKFVSVSKNIDEVYARIDKIETKVEDANSKSESRFIDTGSRIDTLISEQKTTKLTLNLGFVAIILTLVGIFFASISLLYSSNSTIMDAIGLGKEIGKKE